MILSLFFLLILLFFKLSECEDVSIINIIQVKFSCFLLSDCSVYLVAWVGGKLSRPVYLDPHPSEYQSKIILLSFLILNYLNVMMYEL